MDLYAKCTAGANTYTCDDIADPYTSATESTSENNWTVPIEDNDADDRFCTRPADYLTD